MARAFARSPELNAGWPQQVWRGTSTVQPASSSSLTAAKPTDGRIRSTRQVTNSPTRLLLGPAMHVPGKCALQPEIVGKAARAQARARGARRRHNAATA